MKLIFTFFAAIFLIVKPCFSANIEIMNFNLIKNNTQVEINWYITASEEKYLFVIDKSVDAVGFTSVDSIYSEAGIEKYFSKDDTPFNGISYYRVRCINQNGEEVASAISYIEFDAAEQIDLFRISSLYPMPFYDQFNLVIQSKRDISLSIKCYNLDGKLIFEMLKLCSTGCNTIKIGDLIDLKNDSYYLTVSDGYLYTKTTHLIKSAYN